MRNPQFNADPGSNPYAPPTELAAVAIPAAGEVCCPWCEQEIRFLRVYLSLGSTIECPTCSQTSVRRKRGLPAHVSESVLMFLFLAIVLAIYWLAGDRIVFAAIFMMYPVFGLADYLIDRHRLYLAKPGETYFG